MEVLSKGVQPYASDDFRPGSPSEDKFHMNMVAPIGDMSDNEIPASSGSRAKTATPREGSRESSEADDEEENVPRVFPSTPYKKRPNIKKLMELTPLWQQIIKYHRFPSSVDRDKVFTEVASRLRDPEWEVRQHALRVLVDLISVLDQRDLRVLESSDVAAETIINLGHSAPAVRQTATEAFMMYVKKSDDPESVLRSVVSQGLEKSASSVEAGNTTMGVIIALPSLVSQALNFHSDWDLPHNCLVHIVSCLSKKLVQVTYQEQALRALVRIRQLVGEDRFDHVLEAFHPQCKRDFDILCEVYDTKNVNVRDSGIDLHINGDVNGNAEHTVEFSSGECSPVPPEDSSSVSSDSSTHRTRDWNGNNETNLPVVEISKVNGDKTAAEYDSDDESRSDLAEEITETQRINVRVEEAPTGDPPGRVVMETEIKFNEETAITMTILEEEEKRKSDQNGGDYGDQEFSDSDDDHTPIPTNDGNEEMEVVSDDELDVAGMVHETPRRTARRVRFGGEIVKMRTPDSDAAMMTNEEPVVCGSRSSSSSEANSVSGEDFGAQTSQDLDRSSPVDAQSLAIMEQIRQHQQQVQRQIESVRIEEKSKSKELDLSSPQDEPLSIDSKKMIMVQKTRTHSQIPLPIASGNRRLRELNSSQKNFSKETELNKSSSLSVPVPRFRPIEPLQVSNVPLDVERYGQPDSSTIQKSPKVSGKWADDSVNKRQEQKSAVTNGTAESTQGRESPSPISIPTHDGGESLTCSSSESEFQHLVAQEVASQDSCLSLENLALVDPLLVQHLSNKEDWRVQTSALDLLVEQLKDPTLAGKLTSPAVVPGLLRLLVSVLAEDRHARITSSCFAAIRAVVQMTPVEQVIPALPVLVPAVCRRVGGGCPLGVKLEAIQTARALMMTARPGPVADVILTASCIGAKSSKLRECSLLLIMYAAMTFPSVELEGRWARLCARVAVSVRDPRRRVRQAALDALAVLAQFMSPQQLSIAVRNAASKQTNPASTDAFLAAVQARLARRQLPVVAPNGLVLYALQLPANGYHLSSHPVGPDVDWIMAGSGAVSSGSARSRDQLLDFSPPPHTAREGAGRLTVRPGNPWTDRRWDTPLPLSASRMRLDYPRDDERIRGGCVPLPGQFWGPPDYPDHYFFSSYDMAVQTEILMDIGPVLRSVTMDSTQGALPLLPGVSRQPIYYRYPHDPHLVAGSDRGFSVVHPAPASASGPAPAPAPGRHPAPPAHGYPYACAYPYPYHLVNGKLPGPVAGSEPGDIGVNTRERLSQTWPPPGGGSGSEGSSTQYGAPLPRVLSSPTNRRGKRVLDPLPQSSGSAPSQSWSSSGKNDTASSSEQRHKMPPLAPSNAHDTIQNGSLERIVPCDDAPGRAQLSGRRGQRLPIPPSRASALGTRGTPSKSTQDAPKTSCDVHSTPEPQVLHQKPVLARTGNSPSVNSSVHPLSAFDPSSALVQNIRNESLSSHSLPVNSFTDHTVGYTYVTPSITDAERFIPFVQDSVQGPPVTVDGSTCNGDTSASDSPSQTQASLKSNENQINSENKDENPVNFSDNHTENEVQFNLTEDLKNSKIDINSSKKVQPGARRSSIRGARIPLNRPRALTPRSISSNPSTNLGANNLSNSTASLFAESLPALDNPREALSRALRQLDSVEWEVTMQALQTLVRLVRHHTALVQGQLHPCCEALARQVRNLRSQVARAACQAAAHLFHSLKRGMDAEAEDLSGALFNRTADTNKFLRGDSNLALDAMTDTVSPAKAFSAIVHKGCRHQNAVVRASSARLLLRLAEKMGSDRMMSLPREVRDPVLLTSARLLMEGSLETRSYAKALLKNLAQDPRLTSILVEIVPTNVMRSIDKTLKSCLQRK